MISTTKDYILSRNFFFDLLIVACLYFCLFYYIPHLFKSIKRGEIAANVNIYRRKSNPISYLIFLSINFILFLITAIGAVLILDIRIEFLG